MEKIYLNDIETTKIIEILENENKTPTFSYSEDIRIKDLRIDDSEINFKEMTQGALLFFFLCNHIRFYKVLNFNIEEIILKKQTKNTDNYVISKNNLKHFINGDYDKLKSSSKLTTNEICLLSSNPNKIITLEQFNDFYSFFQNKNFAIDKKYILRIRRLLELEHQPLKKHNKNTLKFY
ncbi:MAG: hypothetical protein ACRC4M_05745 [Mycoplasma sp.]